MVTSAKPKQSFIQDLAQYNDMSKEEKKAVRKRFRAPLWVAIIVLVIIGLIINVFNHGSKPEPVQLTLNASRQGTDIVFSGTTNLPDGTLLGYEITGTPESNYFVDGNVSVANGSYSGRAVGTPAGSTEVWLAFQTILRGGEQPADVIKRYGKMGENIKGDVTETGGLKRIEKTATVE